MASKRILLISCLLATLTGCATAALKHQAALDHGCSEDRITVGRAPDDPALPTEVDACGKIRLYRMMSWNEGGMPVWLDVTDLTPVRGGSGK